MSSYSIFFDYNNQTYRLPTNPESMKRSSSMAIEKYEILKLGQIGVPTHMELTEYSFECEFPKEAYSYVETSGNFQDSDYYIKLFKSWREDLVPVRFIASNGLGDDINTMVLIQDVSETEKAGEEGDKYIEFKLLEYREYNKKPGLIQVSQAVGVITKETSSVATNPNSTGLYTVQSGDTLWKIAKAYYGDGSKYTKIYNANTDKIQNPSLIYPGQVLKIPS